jgi:hypothetical protein
MRRGLTLSTLTFFVMLAQSMVGGATAPASSATPFVEGGGDAVAEAISVVPALSGYSLGVETGVSIADYLGTEGQAESQMITSALIGDLNVSTPAGSGGIIAESSSTPSTQSTTVEGGDGQGVGVLAVSAAQSAGLASANLASLNLPGVLDISGGQSTAGTSIVDGETRQAQSSSSIASVSILGGLIVLNGLHWTASQSTGAHAAHAGTFSIASVSVDNTTIAIPADGLSSVIDLINGVLAKTGLRVTLPNETFGSDGSVQESALSIGLDNSELGKELVSPYIPQLQPLRTLLNQTLVEIDPTLGESDLILEIALSILAGQGTLDLNLGGAYATTNGTAYGNSLEGAPASSALGATTLPDLLSGGLAGIDDLPSLAGTLPTSPATTTTVPATGATKVALKELSSASSCRSTSVGGCRSPHSMVIIISLASLTLGLLGLESLRMRRRKRLLLPEES